MQLLQLAGEASSQSIADLQRRRMLQVRAVLPALETMTHLTLAGHHSQAQYADAWHSLISLMPAVKCHEQWNT